MNDYDILGFFDTFRIKSTKDKKREITRMYVQNMITREEFIKRMKELKQGGEL